MNLAYRFPIMFWNCACLISDSGGAESDDEEVDEEGATETTETYFNEMEEFGEDDSEEEITDSYDEEDCDGYPATVCVMKDGKKKKKVKNTNYGKIATAIGRIKASGVDVAPPDINKSKFTFYPDIDNNTIRYGLSGITKIGEELIRAIMDGRPFKSMDDFTNRVKINKAQVVNLIKSGAFDCFGDRVQVMREYIESVSDAKKRITLQNMKMLCDFGLIPNEYDMQRRVYNFNKYLKKFKWNNYYLVDEIALNFYEQHFDMDKLRPSTNGDAEFMIKQTDWDNIYQHHMDIIRPWVKKNAADLLIKVNDRLMGDTWNKYCLGSLSKWEMDAVSFYSHEHELAHIKTRPYELTNFHDIPENPVVERVLPIKGKQIPIMKIFRIAGTVLDRDKAKKTVTLLTTDGVVTVKVFGQVFAHYDKQISEKGADGKKHVIEKSNFNRGNKIIVSGIRVGENEFLAKKYARTPWHLIEKIDEVREDGSLVISCRETEEN